MSRPQQAGIIGELALKAWQNAPWLLDALQLLWQADQEVELRDLHRLMEEQRAASSSAPAAAPRGQGCGSPIGSAEWIDDLEWKELEAACSGRRMPPPLLCFEFDEDY